MARILIGTFPVVGHVTPFLPLARALVRRGHRVIWNCSPAFQDRIEATGVRFLPSRQARDMSDFRRGDLVPGGDSLTGVAALKVDLKYGFIDNAPRQMEDLKEIAHWFNPDVILCDPGFIGGLFYHELTGIPLAVLSILPMMLSSADTAPNGLGIPPTASPFGRVRNQFLNWAVEHVLFRDVQKHWNATRAELGLDSTGWLMDTPTRASVYLQATVPGFEYPRRDLAQNVHFIGMLPASTPAEWLPPSWWGELDGSRPVVHVTQGTLANAKPTLIQPALTGLAGEDVLVVVSTGGPSAGSLGLQVPKNARIAPFLSYPDLLPRTSLMVTNGGYGGTQIALSHGVPLVAAGTTEDKPEVAARIAWSGAGINLRTESPTPEQVRAAVRKVLHNPAYRHRAQALAAEYGQYDAVGRAVEILEQLSRQDRVADEDAVATPVS